MSLPDVDSAVYSKLTGNIALNSWAAGGVHEGYAPEEASLPQVVFYQAVYAPPNDSPREIHEFVYRVEAVGSTRGQAQSGAALIYGAMHNQALTVSGFSNYWMVVVGGDHILEIEAGKRYYRRMIEIEISLSAV